MNDWGGCYKDAAIFRCNPCRQEERRDRCSSFRGRLVCSRCRIVGTLVFTGRIDGEARQEISAALGLKGG